MKFTIFSLHLSKKFSQYFCHDLQINFIISFLRLVCRFCNVLSRLILKFCNVFSSWMTNLAIFLFLIDEFCVYFSCDSLTKLIIFGQELIPKRLNNSIINSAMTCSKHATEIQKQIFFMLNEFCFVLKEKKKLLNCIVHHLDHYIILCWLIFLVKYFCVKHTSLYAFKFLLKSLFYCLLDLDCHTLCNFYFRVLI